jgi:gamma-glutamylcyclotransferase (GGCT)/AIG2-like uncharacterized protein YtfP
MTKNFIYVLKYIITCTKSNSPMLLEQFFLINRKGEITMKILVLKKQHEPRFDELNEMISGLKDFLDAEVDFNDVGWNMNFDILLDFQDSDGSFKLLDSFNVPSDARVDFCYMPTYIAAAFLMKVYMTDPSEFTLEEKDALSKGLKISTARNLTGHGYEGLKGQIEALNIFMKAGLNEFLDLYPDLCPEFSGMIKELISKFEEMELEGKFSGPWGESYEEEIRSINRYFRQRKVFVYGTLMSGETNHHYLENSFCLGKATIKGYGMYYMGWYLAIIPGDGLIIGEIYQVPINDMPSIDMLEGEGTLYNKKCEIVTDANGRTTFALVYVYIGDCSGHEKIPAWKKDYVWYVSYGSNMLKDRFLCYIKGGSFEGSRHHPPCDDTTLPVAVRTFDIPYGMYFANVSGSWHGSAVSFLDTTNKGKSLGVAYLITKEQFVHVCARENDGRSPTPGYGWYEDIIDLGVMDGFEVKTITNNSLRQPNQPSTEYLGTLFRGIKENWPEMSDEEIKDYLNACMR